MSLLKEFKPTIFFLLKFGLIFGLGSVFYSKWVGSYNEQTPPQVDPATEVVGQQTYKLIRALDYPVHMWYPVSGKTVGIYLEGFEDDSIGVYEGCNGVNIMILFVAFIVAFGGKWQRMLWFIPSGILAIHLFNLLRLSSLTIMASLSQSFFHFFHKYAFTGVIYLFVLLLWVVWVKRFYTPSKSKVKAK